MSKKKILFLHMWCFVILFVASTSFAAVIDRVRAVPWHGNPSSFHTTISGESVKLKGVIDAHNIFGADPLVAAAWIPGSDNILRIVYPGGSYVSWIRAVVSVGSVDNTVCMYDYNGGSCDVLDLCAATYSASSFDVNASLGSGATPDRIYLETINSCSSGTFSVYLNGALIKQFTANPTSECICATPLQSTFSNSEVTAWYKWNFGDGTESAVTEITGVSPIAVEADHTYVAAVGTPFTAVLMVDGVDSTMANAIPDSYLVQTQEDTLDARVNIAIDEGLWYLYKNQMQSASIASLGNEPVTAWSSYSSYYPSATAVAIQAFEINNHKETGNFNEDPYAEVVGKGLNWLLNGSFGGAPILTSLALPVANSHNVNADTNGNSIGVQIGYSGLPAYQGGMIMDAIVSAGTPDADSARDFDGVGGTDSYQKIIQDMVDAYAWGQGDGGASATYATGWSYTWNESRTDNSTNQWAAIGLIPAMTEIAHRQPGLDGILYTADDVVEFWATMPGFVTEYMDYSLTYTYNASQRYFGYDGPDSLVGTAAVTRPSGMVQMLLAHPDTYSSDVRWTGPESWYAQNFDSAFSAGQRSYYGWLSFVKSMIISNTEQLSNGFNWYRGSAATTGLAKRLINEQEGDGSWPQDGQVSHPGYYGDIFVTGWAIQMLKPALFQTAPIACFTASPNSTYENRDIAFDPSCSDHSDADKDITNLVSFEWDFENDGTYDISSAGPNIQHHAFTCDNLPCVYPVVLRVTDDEGIDATYSLNINITNPPHPPEADAGGPYLVSQCADDQLTLDGSQSFDPNEGTHETGCASCQGDTITAWGWDFTAPLTGFNDATGEVVTLTSGNIVTFFPAAGSHTIGLQVTDNTALAYPASGDPALNLTGADFANVSIYARLSRLCY